MLAAFLQLLVGMPYELVKEHYLRTNEHFAPRLNKLVRFTPAPHRVRLMLTARDEYLDAVYDRIVSDYGDVEAYLQQACGVPELTLKRLKGLLT